MLYTQVAALTTDQVQALSTDQIVALTTAQVKALETADLAALSTDQIGALETRDLAALTTAQSIGFDHRSSAEWFKYCANPGIDDLSNRLTDHGSNPGTQYRSAQQFDDNSGSCADNGSGGVIVNRSNSVFDFLDKALGAAHSVHAGEIQITGCYYGQVFRPIPDLLFITR